MTGVDLSEELLAAARAEPAPPGAAPLRWIRDACALDLPEGALDFVYARFLFQRLSETGPALREIVRVPQPGGRPCVMEVDNAIFGPWPEAPAFRQLVALAGEGQRRRGGDRPMGHKLAWCAWPGSARWWRGSSC